MDVDKTHWTAEGENVPKCAHIYLKTFKCGGGDKSLRTQCKQCTPTINNEWIYISHMIVLSLVKKLFWESTNIKD